MAQYNNNVLGQSGSNFFFGKVEDNLDPLKIARVQVRCFGIHSPDEATLPKANLPWASVMFPTTSNDLAISDLKIGTTVFGLFIDGDEMQVPFIIGVVPGINAATGLPTLSGQATGLERPQKATRDANRLTGMSAVGNSFDEPSDAFNAVYPQNHAIVTDGGHVFELDDTIGSERINIFHKNGTYVEFRPDGDVVVKSTKDKYEIVSGNGNCYFKGNLNLVVDGSVNIAASGNMNIKGDVNVDGDVIASGISLMNHIHGGVKGGPDKTSPPDA